jgi:hypothetical protein
MKPKKQKRLLQWTTGEVIDYFGLEYSVDTSAAAYWSAPDTTLSEKHKERLSELRTALSTDVSFWNEEELKIYFIGQVIDLAKYQESGARGFFEREIETEVNNLNIRMNADFLIARGIDVPKAPYFCLQEYKKEKKSANDPEAQMLLAMIAAQDLNASDHPVYGVFVIGSHWRFTKLHGNRYHLSLPFEATSEEGLHEIFRILLVIKEFVAKRVQEDKQREGTRQRP